MKNEHIRLGEVVPPEIRLECYKEAKRIIQGNISMFGMNPEHSLCLLLPCILWDLDSYLDKSPLGHYWHYPNCPKSFLEMDEFNLVDRPYNIKDQNWRELVRIAFLDWAIQKLESC